MYQEHLCWFYLTLALLSVLNGEKVVSLTPTFLMLKDFEQKIPQQVFTLAWPMHFIILVVFQHETVTQKGFVVCAAFRIDKVS